MWIIVIFISVINILLAFIINAKTAKYVLAGYNTMSEEERKSFDIVGFIKDFKKVCLLTGLTIPIVYYLFYFFSQPEYGFIFVIIIISLILPYLLYLGKKYRKDSYFTSSSKFFFFGIYGIIIFVFPVLLIWYGLCDNNIEFLESNLVISGMYGQEIKYNEIKNVSLEDYIPKTTIRTNGFALGRHLKGYYETANGKTIKLYVELRKPPYLNIVTTRDNIFWNYSDAKVDSVYNKLKKKMN